MVCAVWRVLNQAGIGVTDRVAPSTAKVNSRLTCCVARNVHMASGLKDALKRDLSVVAHRRTRPANSILLKLFMLIRHLYIGHLSNEERLAGGCLARHDLNPSKRFKKKIVDGLIACWQSVGVCSRRIPATSFEASVLSPYIGQSARTLR